MKTKEELFKESFRSPTPPTAAAFPKRRHLSTSTLEAGSVAAAISAEVRKVWDPLAGADLTPLRADLARLIEDLKAGERKREDFTREEVLLLKIGASGRLDQETDAAGVEARRPATTRDELEKQIRDLRSANEASATDLQQRIRALTRSIERVGEFKRQLREDALRRRQKG